jgi:hypothetical protein
VTGLDHKVQWQAVRTIGGSHTGVYRDAWGRNATVPTAAASLPPVPLPPRWHITYRLDGSPLAARLALPAEEYTLHPPTGCPDTEPPDPALIAALIARAQAGDPDAAARIRDLAQQHSIF